LKQHIISYSNVEFKVVILINNHSIIVLLTVFSVHIEFFGSRIWYFI